VKQHFGNASWRLEALNTDQLPSIADRAAERIGANSVTATNVSNLAAYHFLEAR
jgi:hypothetical protein